MRARLENADGTFVAEVEAPDGALYIRFGERLFAHTPIVEPRTLFFASRDEGKALRDLDAGGSLGTARRNQRDARDLRAGASASGARERGASRL